MLTLLDLLLVLLFHIFLLWGIQTKRSAISLDEKGQLEKIKLLLVVSVGAYVVSKILKLGDPFELGALIFTIFALLLLLIDLM